jgi:hypothetical protein
MQAVCEGQALLQITLCCTVLRCFQFETSFPAWFKFTDALGELAWVDHVSAEV